jgi:hypothetical protein
MYKDKRFMHILLSINVVYSLSLAFWTSLLMTFLTSSMDGSDEKAKN